MLSAPPLDVSVIVPCFRQGHLLARAVRSVLDQGYPGVEVIVVNDGSDDDTESVAASFGDHIHYMRLPNGGPSPARNAGLARSRGRYVIFLDADDLLAPGAIAALHGAVAGRDDLLGVGAWKHFDDESDLPSVEPLHPVVKGTALSTILSRNIAPLHAFITPSAALKAVGGFMTTLRGCEDWDCWARLIVGGADVVTVPHVVAYYRNTPDSNSKNFMRMFLGRAEVLMHIHEVLLTQPDRLRAHGQELLETETRFLRRLIARRVRNRDVTGRVRRAIRELNAAGIRLPASSLRRVTERILGTYAEDLTIAFYRVTSRDMMQYYLSGWN